MKVAMTEAICQEGLALLEGKADIFVAHDAHPHNYLDQLKDTDAFIVRVADKGAIDKETMESSDSLKVIGRTGIGYDSVDVESATKLGIKSIICMPAGAPISKVEATKQLGAEVRLVKGAYDDAYATALQLQEDTGLISTSQSLRYFSRYSP